jgi:hypothetical protein
VLDYVFLLNYVLIEAKWSDVNNFCTNFVGLEQGFCEDFVECLMKDGKPKVASKYTYFYFQKSHK